MSEGWDRTRHGDRLHYFEDDVILCRAEKDGWLAQRDEGYERRKCKMCLGLLAKAGVERMMAKEAHRQKVAESAKLAQEFMDRLTG